MLNILALKMHQNKIGIPGSWKTHHIMVYCKGSHLSFFVLKSKKNIFSCLLIHMKENFLQKQKFYTQCLELELQKLAWGFFHMWEICICEKYIISEKNMQTFPQTSILYKNTLIKAFMQNPISNVNRQI